MRVAFVGRKQVLDFLPLRVRQIAWVAFVLRTITFTLLFGPHEVTPCWRIENMGAPQSNRLSGAWHHASPPASAITGLWQQERDRQSPFEKGHGTQRVARRGPRWPQELVGIEPFQTGSQNRSPWDRR